MLEVGHGLFFLQECLKIISLLEYTDIIAVDDYSKNIKRKEQNWSGFSVNAFRIFLCYSFLSRLLPKAKI